MEDRNDFFEAVKQIILKRKKIYIYGAGIYARNIYNILNEKKIKVDGFIVTKCDEKEKLYGLPILNADSIINNEVGIIIGANSLNRKEIVNKLQESNFNMEFVINGTNFIEKDNIRYNGSPTMEITTRVGCKVNCKYCPQDLLINRYFLGNKQREEIMSLEMFEKCLHKLPKDVRICFCGMSEPFLNPHCSEMIIKAHEDGRIIELYTTLVGANKEIIEKIIDVPFGFVVLHVPDKYKYAHIPVTEEYCELLKFVINYKRKDGSAFINICNAQAEPDEKVAEICRNRYEILTALHDRAGNLQDENLLNKKTPTGKITCSLCGTKLNHNNLLPDGTVLLCDFDYKMQHVLGNLSEQTYDEILSSNEWRRVFEGMSGDTNQQILCRKCSCANSL